jgi:predicted esterase
MTLPGQPGLLFWGSGAAAVVLRLTAQDSAMQEHRIETSVQGRYLVRKPSGGGQVPLLAGFHGYGQTAEDELALLGSIRGSDRWLLCSIEALHPFYNTRGEAGSCWMTSRDRELRIAENIRFVDAVLDRIRASCPAGGPLVLHGFSQGAGMACRAALLGRHPSSALMLLGGDIPP